ncbi:hypothetical protein A2716_04310 [candidate division WWE3 bacterium RIFCSPHIGHO2_01_FULL_40_23]|uniref:Methyltransferase domain-containing protein n=1 Tax=candidate division WWE3 bacterium RIFCSPLOWO2_01_FULL_41_18 TaxID=1802625 RepID=A0A1F4VD70_UNCKA|nr:MAG: hypothetical protein A2716_04310 [candidate division WWE3 bacterium RIFCSPHIGHO2_01_FULL_40_23]OGC55097.1 MAG: hypothetical protein A3A78_03920 [candidate division WWE3 bacterium RIFCSPLOWO2_01_FULL_41_18]
MEEKTKTTIEQVERYWSKQSEMYLNTDERGFGAVIYSGMPIWFNSFFNHYQQKAFMTLTEGINFSGLSALDVGSGVGRWSHILYKKGCKVIGIDFEKSRLQKAKKNPNLKNITFKNMSVVNLEFEDNIFDFTNSITVLQHIPHENKSTAIKEVCRATKKGGYILIIELIDLFDDAPHVFPLSDKGWIDIFANNGCELIKKVGCEFSPLLRILRYIRYVLTKKKNIDKSTGRITLSKFELLIMRVVILLSYPIEEVCVSITPAKYARHGGYLFKKLSKRKKEF